jgi:hypothetical protein
MCRNIVPLHNFDPPASDAECHDAALQFVRKIAGTSSPSRRNREVLCLSANRRQMATEVDRTQRTSTDWGT